MPGRAGRPQRGPRRSPRPAGCAGPRDSSRRTTQPRFLQQVERRGHGGRRDEDALTDLRRCQRLAGTLDDGERGRCRAAASRRSPLDAAVQLEQQGECRYVPRDAYDSVLPVSASGNSCTKPASTRMTPRLAGEGRGAPPAPAVFPARRGVRHSRRSRCEERRRHRPAACPRRGRGRARTRWPGPRSGSRA